MNLIFCLKELTLPFIPLCLFHHQFLPKHWLPSTHKHTYLAAIFKIQKALPQSHVPFYHPPSCHPIIAKFPKVQSLLKCLTSIDPNLASIPNTLLKLLFPNSLMAALLKSPMGQFQAYLADLSAACDCDNCENSLLPFVECIFPPPPSLLSLKCWTLPVASILGLLQSSYSLWVSTCPLDSDGFSYPPPALTSAELHTSTTICNLELSSWVSRQSFKLNQNWYGT